MKGKHHIIVKNRSLHYEFDIRRNITIIQGNSATGKTTLISMIRQVSNLGADSGIEIVCDVDCMPLEGPGWKLLLRHVSNTIFFSDEDSAFITTEEFAREVGKSDNYVVLITRENLYNLPYSVEEIYGIHSSGKYLKTQRTYQTFYHIYPTASNASAESQKISPEMILTEDSNSVFQFFENVCAEKGITCKSAGGKSGFFAMLREVRGRTVRVVADGAAIGPEMDRLSKLIQKNSSFSLYLPESFEWILLKSGLIDGRRMQEILEHPEDFIDSRDYMSWEQYFTRLLAEETEGTHLQYHKKRLNAAYLYERSKKAILDVIGWL